MGAIRCQRDELAIEDCDRVGQFVYTTEGEGPKRVCAKHYQLELEIDLEVWDESHGSFCLECGKRIHQFIDRHDSLPCLCVKHLAKKMREDEGVMDSVRAAFKKDVERLTERLLKEVDDGEASHTTS